MSWNRTIFFFISRLRCQGLGQVSNLFRSHSQETAEQFKPKHSDCKFHSYKYHNILTLWVFIKPEERAKSMEYLLVVTACRRTAGCDEKWIILNQSSVKSWPCPVAQSQRYYSVLWDHLSQDEREATICTCCRERERDLETMLTKEKLCKEGRKIRPDSIFGCIPIKGIFIHLNYFFSFCNHAS